MAEFTTNACGRTLIYICKKSLFPPGQYLIANYGFPTKINVVPAFKEPMLKYLSCERSSINTWLL